MTQARIDTLAKMVVAERKENARLQDELVELKRQAGKYTAGCELCEERERDNARLRAALEKTRDKWELGGACSAATATAALEQGEAIRQCPECGKVARQIWMQEHISGCSIGRAKPLPMDDDEQSAPATEAVEERIARQWLERHPEFLKDER